MLKTDKLHFTILSCFVVRVNKAIDVVLACIIA